MKPLNLLPIWYMQKLQFQQLIKRTATLVTVLFLFFVLLITILHITNGILETRINKLQAEIENNKYVETDMAALSLMQLTRQIQFLPVQSQLTDNLKSLLSPAASTSQVYAWEVTYQRENETFTFQGVAYSREAISTLEQELSRLGRFQQITITQLNKTDNGHMFFSIELSVKNSQKQEQKQ